MAQDEALEKLRKWVDGHINPNGLILLPTNLTPKLILKEVERRFEKKEWPDDIVTAIFKELK